MAMCFPYSALNVKVVRNSRQARVNGGRSHDSSQASQRCDCQSEWALLQLGFSSRWRARRATSYRRRGAGRSRRVAAASRRCGRNGRRAGSGEARFLILANLARQSHAMVLAWWNPCIIRLHCAAAGGAGGAGGGTEEEQGRRRCAL